MNLTKWEPLRELENVYGRLNRIFKRGGLRHESSDETETLKVADWVPSVDISETDSAYLIKGEIPGVERKDIRVTLERGMLTIQGERKQEKEEKGEKFYRCECSYGSFVRSFRVPEDADESVIKAEFRNGVLNVSINKSAKAKARTVDISVS